MHTIKAGDTEFDGKLVVGYTAEGFATQERRTAARWAYG